MFWTHKDKQSQDSEEQLEIKFWKKAAEDAIQASRAKENERMQTIDWNAKLIEQKRELSRFIEMILENNILPKDSGYYGMALDLVSRYGERQTF